MTLMLFSMAAYAVPAKKGLWRTIVLNDGTEVTATLCGDEHMHYYVDAQGQCYEMTDEEEIFHLTDLATLQAKAVERQAKTTTIAKSKAMNKVAGVGDGIYGEKKGIIILVEFYNKSFLEGHDQELYYRIANEEGFTSDDGFQGSVHDYFLDQSNGLFNLTFDVVGPVTLENSFPYYGTNDSYGNDSRPGEMVVEACTAVDDIVDFSDYDWDGDGEVEQVFILYAGLGEASGGSSTTIWPHKWDLQSSDYGSTLTLDGVTINTYACSCELTKDYSTYTNVIDGIGTICHEFSHCLGLYDIYDSNGSNFGMSTWDLMDYGNYNADGFIPSGYTSYEKWVAGWLEPIELVNDTIIENILPLSENGDAYIIYNDKHENEFYMLENRQLTGWDAGQYGSGLLILHIDYDEDAWENRTINTDALRQRCTIFHADNSDGDVGDTNGYEDIGADPYPYLDNDSLTNNSTPAAILYNINSTGTYYMNTSVTDIAIDDNGCASFTFKTSQGYVSENDDPEGTIYFQETFDQCSGTGGNDGKWSGNIANSTLLADMDGWTTIFGRGAYQCARFGSSTKSGQAVSPTFSMTGEVALTFLAAPWGSEETDMAIIFNDETVTTVSLTTQQWTEFTVTLQGDYTGEGVITFYSPNRFFLDEVVVMKPYTSGITATPTSTNRVSDGRVYSIDGRYLGNDIDTLGKGIYIIDGKKTVK